MGSESLLEKSKPVTQFDDSLLELIEKLKIAMYAEGGVGIAAPQIGINKRVIVFGFEKNERYPNEDPIPFTVLINPEYEALSTEMTDDWEGCLSVPGMRGLVPRFNKISYQGFDANQNIIKRTVDGFHARVIQHEVDHLDGILYPFRIKDLKYFGFEEALL